MNLKFLLGCDPLWKTEVHGNENETLFFSFFEIIWPSNMFQLIADR